MSEEKLNFCDKTFKTFEKIKPVLFHLVFAVQFSPPFTYKFSNKVVCRTRRRPERKWIKKVSVVL